jgi:hypothetical protein
MVILGAMKTTKAKTTSTAKKSPSAVKTAKAKKPSVSKAEPTEEEIRMKAQEIYDQRMHKGEHGTASDDWHKAERLLKGI